MFKILIESEDFSPQELLTHLENEGMAGNIETSILFAKKEGLSSIHDQLEFFIQNDVESKIAFEIVKEVIKFGVKKVGEYAFSKPTILVKFKNGSEFTIKCYEKSDAAISKELMAFIEEGEVFRVIFKS
jgi:hypothetical protein